MRLVALAIFFYFISTTVVESFLISALIGFKIGYALASRLLPRSLEASVSYRVHTSYLCGIKSMNCIPIPTVAL